MTEIAAKWLSPADRLAYERLAEEKLGADSARWLKTGEL